MSHKNELKRKFTVYWEYLAIKAACKLNIFDLIHEGHNTLESLLKARKFNANALRVLLISLENSGLIKTQNSEYQLTESGHLLTEQHPESLKAACILWGEEHLDAWKNLDYTIETGKPSFEKIYKTSFFYFLSCDPTKLDNYHKAMNSYARDDYEKICQIINFNDHHAIMDIGGSFGYMINNIAQNHPKIKCYLFDKTEVVAGLSFDNLKLIGGDFLIEIPKVADALILSRIIHDWDDSHAKIVLDNCHTALPEKGTIYIIENLTDKIGDRATLLTLNMMTTCRSFERSEKEYRLLLKSSGFETIGILKLNDLQYIIKATKV
jgi:C-methyltransferase